MKVTPSIDKAIAEISNLPGIGEKSSQRLVFHLLKKGPAKIRQLYQSLEALVDRVKVCDQCANFTEGSDLCHYCLDINRDKSLICVVETASDIYTLEQSGAFKGTYHVLGGLINPLMGIGPDDISISMLIKRLRSDSIKEMIMALNSNLEGETTALYLQEQVASLGVTVTRLAQGVPMGGQLDFLDGRTLEHALKNRRQIGEL